MAYSDGEKAEALIKLWHSKYAYESVSNDLDIPVRTLRRWDKAVPKKTIPDLLTTLSAGAAFFCLATARLTSGHPNTTATIRKQATNNILILTYQSMHD